MGWLALGKAATTGRVKDHSGSHVEAMVKPCLSGEPPAI